MKISEGLQTLIDASFADGKISKNEREVLSNKAVGEGLNGDEFSIYLDGLLQKSKSENVSFWNKSLYHQKEGYVQNDDYEDVYKKEINFKTKHLAIILGGLVIIGLGIFTIVLDKISKNDEILAKYGCTDFNDCLSNYKFDGAYFYYNQEKQKFETSGQGSILDNILSGKGEEIFNKYQKLITGQVSYWNQNKKYENSINILQEYSFSSSYVLATDDEDDNKGYNLEVSFYNNLLGDVITKMIIDNVNKDDLFKYSNLYKPLVIGNEDDKSMFGGDNSFVLNEEQYKKALVRINELK